MKKNMNARITTKIGKILDRTSYVQIGGIILSIILGASFYFWFFNSRREGTTAITLHWYNAIYFSIITFSTLGYGDIAPVGFGKVVASIEVLSGLMLVAVFVGKLASERQSAMLLLIYTSVHQERLSGFVEDISTLQHGLELALTDLDHTELYSKAESGFNFISGIYRYLRFQANQGGLASYGNKTTLRKLYKAINGIQLKAYESFRTFGVQPRTLTHLEKLIESAEAIALVMKEFHQDDEIAKDLLSDIISNATEFRKWKLSAAEGTARYQNHSEYVESVIEQVKLYLPPPPWEKHIHKKMAKDLAITNALAHSCISDLVDRGYWPELKKPDS